MPETEQSSTLPEVLLAFWGDDTPTVEELTSGHVHQTLKVVSGEGTYILQGVNDYVFRNPSACIENIRLVTEHLLKDEAYDLQVPMLFPDRKGDYLFLDGQGKFWRCMTFIPDSVTRAMPSDTNQTYEVALAFGKFSKSLATLDASCLTYTIPKFHDPEARWQQFEQSLAESRRTWNEELTFIRSQIADARSVFMQMQALDLPLKVAHNDPKITNVLFDPQGAPVSIIDLDTVMPGYSLHDFGDLVRSMANSVTEDHPNIDEVSLLADRYEALYAGFCDGAADSLDSIEQEQLSLGALYIILEQAVRFYADYLMGNIYYRVKNDDHNLLRAKNQLALFQHLQHYLAK